MRCAYEWIWKISAGMQMMGDDLQSASPEKIKNLFLKFISLPICGGVGTSVGFLMVSLILFKKVTLHVLVGFMVFSYLGAILSMIIGWPLYAIVEWGFHKYKYRYIWSGWVCALLAWLLVEGAFFRGGWLSVWTNKSFWLDWAPSRIFVFSVIGLTCGVIYTGAVWLINKKYPYSD